MQYSWLWKKTHGFFISISWDFYETAVGSDHTPHGWAGCSTFNIWAFFSYKIITDLMLTKTIVAMVTLSFAKASKHLLKGFRTNAWSSLMRCNFNHMHKLNSQSQCSIWAERVHMSTNIHVPESIELFTLWSLIQWIWRSFNLLSL